MKKQATNNPLDNDEDRNSTTRWEEAGFSGFHSVQHSEAYSDAYAGANSTSESEAKYHDQA